MKKEIRTNKDGVIQITLSDERWYIKQDGENNVFVPSVTWIAGCYPKGVQFYKWLAEQGWDESQSIKVAAGDKGSKVHAAICDLLAGKEVGMDSKYLNNSTGQDEELSLEEYDCLVSFSKWFDEVKPETIANEIVVFGDGYAGTIDWVGRINGKIYIVDWKTGQSIWPEYELQVSAYKHGYPGVVLQEQHGKSIIKVTKPVEGLAILQLGYKRNKNRYKFTEIEDKFELFQAARKIWANEHGGEEPTKLQYPESLKLNIVKTI